ncbi:hypothetical protein B0J11DRAFT_236917 [Dendryphion nanum]|uniref:Uncharacterized protein n=1 Tax=Dendryphion nanum TaxID=256645 RepID=A0A9P9CZ45_9PLEO|nr:hypothetical protein B0J11DRAFT_236917 [Dendryphion nanum]
MHFSYASSVLDQSTTCHLRSFVAILSIRQVFSSTLSDLIQPCLLAPMLLLCFLTFQLLLPPMLAMQITIWDSNGCKTMPPSWKGFLGPGNGCQVRYQDRGNPNRDRYETGVIAQMVEDSEEDASQIIVFFEGDDCDPKRIITRSDKGTCSQPIAGKYGSWEIWDLCNGTIGCDFED